MDDGVNAKELLWKHLLAAKEIEHCEDFNRIAREKFYLDEYDQITERGTLLATIVQSDFTLQSPQ
ncbi:MAG: hypothetical protein CMH03_10175 [Marinovum sp.]|mgnify:FL=1|nr:hypothetical protein [Marinovum sp.]